MIPSDPPLPRGNTSVVVRDGTTVRRSTGPWTPAVHALLRHLESCGFDGAPRVLGFDDGGREVLSFLPGEVGHRPPRSGVWSDNVLVSAARLLRRFHDATLGFVPPADAHWLLPPPTTSEPHDVVCHKDAAPYNTVFAGGLPVALIDFDTAGPGPRRWDIAHTLYRWVPLSAERPIPNAGASALLDMGDRLRRFRDAYALDARDGLIDLVRRRLLALALHVEQRAVAGDPAYRRLLAEGHAAYYRREAAHVGRHTAAWRSALEAGDAAPVTTER